MFKINCIIYFVLFLVTKSSANSEAKRLYSELINGYSNLIRPVGNNSDRLTVKLGLKLSQLIDVNLKNQIMTTNVWVEQEWIDYKLKWDPEEYGGVSKLHVPSEDIWLPDIVLYNNADGNYEVTIMTKAILHSDGLVTWNPPAIYKSSCEIDVEYFPFDEQNCFMKFGSWTYDGYTVDLKHKHQSDNSPDIKIGMDLSAFYLSVEWDIMAVTAKRKEKFYSCCEEPYPDITFNITLRRKTLFYTVNLIIPCVAISFLSILVFYLPADSGEKVSLSISIMLSLGVFFLLLAEIIPPTSLNVPLLGRYLLFTMVLVTLSVVVTIAVLNVNFRSPATHRMAPWVKSIFIEFLPKFLCMQRPKGDADDTKCTFTLSKTKTDTHFKVGIGLCEKSVLLPTKIGTRKLSNSSLNGSSDLPPPPPPEKLRIPEPKAPHPSDSSDQCSNGIEKEFSSLPSYNITTAENDPFVTDVEPVSPMPHPPLIDDLDFNNKKICPEIERAIVGIRFVAQHKKNLDNYLKIEEDWKYVAMVLDRLFLWIFAFACIVGSVLIILRAPSLYDDKQPIDVILSKVNVGTN